MLQLWDVPATHRVLPSARTLLNKTTSKKVIARFFAIASLAVRSANVRPAVGRPARLSACVGQGDSLPSLHGAAPAASAGARLASPHLTPPHHTSPQRGGLRRGLPRLSPCPDPPLPSGSRTHHTAPLSLLPTDEDQPHRFHGQSLPQSPRPLPWPPPPRR